ncbi:MAG TPA: EAL domain-containing protein [Chromatiales bacterium]|nr:EAL domain-containing protein [Chromatiales bacterium]
MHSRPPFGGPAAAQPALWHGWLRPRGPKAVVVVLAIGLLMVGVVGLVYATGGLKYVYAHTMYLPVLLAALSFGVRGGVLAALAGGLILGPLVPLEVATGETQPAINWLYRIGFFLLVGTVVGAASTAFKRHLDWQAWMLRHNPLTGLPNQAALLEALRANPADALGLMVVQIDNLLEISNTLGYEAVDRVILTLARRLVEHRPPDAQVYHYHPERLALLLPGATREEIEAVALELHPILSSALEVDHVPVYVDIYLGAIAQDGHIVHGDDLVKKADAAMAYAHDRATAFALYDEEVEGPSREAMSLLGGLPEAIRRGHLVLHYQPKVDLTRRRIVGVEALLRWNHPDLGLLPPGKFVPMLEGTELVQAVTRWVLRNACRQLAEWRAAGFDLTVAVNVTVRNLMQEDFHHFVDSHLRECGVPASALEIEVTESSLMVDPRQVLRVLAGLRRHGHPIAIDDFGTGYSSLAYLADFPATSVKIDQAFVRVIEQRPRVESIVRHAIGMAKAVGMHVTAEGVETASVAERLQAMGCDYGQGYYFSRPVAADALMALFYDETRWPAARLPRGEDGRAHPG